MAWDFSCYLHRPIDNKGRGCHHTKRHDLLKIDDFLDFVLEFVSSFFNSFCEGVALGSAYSEDL